MGAPKQGWFVADPSPRLVRRVCLPASYVVFFAGLLMSSFLAFSDKPFDAREAVISDLLSPDENPRGYGAGAAGTAASGLLLIPAAALFYRRLGFMRRKATAAGTVLFAAGLAAAIAIGCLAPFTHGYTPLHIQLAFAALIGIYCGTLIWSAIAAPAAVEGGSSWAPALVGMVAVHAAELLFLVYLYFTPDFFDNGRLLTGLAFWEWVLCVAIGVSLLILADAVEALTTRRCSAGE